MIAVALAGLELGREVLAQTEIKDFGVATNIKTNVLGLDIPVDETKESMKTRG
jgi:hypothetical protein